MFPLNYLFYFYSYLGSIQKDGFHYYFPILMYHYSLFLFFSLFIHIISHLVNILANFAHIHTCTHMYTFLKIFYVLSKHKISSFHMQLNNSKLNQNSQLAKTFFDKSYECNFYYI